VAGGQDPHESVGRDEHRSDVNVRFSTVLLIVISLCFSVKSVQAKGPFSVIRLVNDRPITQFELSQRVKLLEVLGASGGNIEALAMEQLTEDRLKTQAAEAIGMTLQQDAFEEAFASFAQQRQSTPDALRSSMSRAGVAKETLDDFVETGVLWRDLVNIRFRSRATPSPSDLENILNYAASARQESVFIREIAIPFAERGNEGARQLAEQIIRDVRNGSSFAALARQYSRTPTAANGGAVGWTPANRLPPLFAGQILSLSPGDVSAPIEVPAGIIVIQLADIRENPAATDTGMTISYTRIDVPFHESNAAEAEQKAVSLADQIGDCNDAESRFSEFGPASGRYGPDTISALPPNVALALASLDAGESAVLSPTSAGISVITLCNRAATDDPEAIANLERQVFNQRMNNYASSFIQELQADAIIVDR